jgi:CRISPR type IV-associated protein Csf2
MKISVVVRNQTPIHSSDPVQAKITLDGKIQSANERLGFPLIRMRGIQAPLIFGDGTVRMGQLPCVPQNTMRNLLRRAALEDILAPLRGSSSLAVGAYAAAYAGNATGNPEGQNSSFEETIRIRQHCFLGLFGGGPRFIHGRLSVDNLYPIIPSAARVIGQGYEDRYVTGDIKSVVWMRRVDPIKQVRDEVQASIIADGPQAITSWCLADVERQSKRKDAEEEGADNSRGLNAFNAHEVVSPGIDWVWSLKISNPTDAQAGLVLKAIKTIADLGMQVGGGNARDYGKIEIQDVVVDGESVWMGDEYSDQVMPLFDALAEDIDKVSASDFEDFIKATEKKGKA